MKKTIKLVLLVAWMVVIFMFSSQNASVSSQTSNGLLYFLYKLFGFAEGDLSGFISTFSYLIRKFAHFTEFLILGILLYTNVNEYFEKNREAISLLSGFVYALSDEFHQLFVEGRACSLKDVAIDSCGVLCGIVICCIFVSLFRVFKKTSKSAV